MEVEKFLIKYEVSMKEALKKLNEVAEKILFIVNTDNQLIGALSDGDIRRWILKTGGINGAVESAFNKNPVYFYEDYNIEEVKKKMIEKKIECIPIVDTKKKVIDVLIWSHIFGEKYLRQKQNIDIPVVIMAGGKGNRLDPFTRILPKPLIPIGEKPVIEIIMSNFAEYGIKNFYITVNYMAKMVKVFLENFPVEYKISFIKEDEPLGTAGGLKYLEGKIDTPFFVSNCDIIVKTDYYKIYEFHKNGKFDFTIVASMRHHIVPYGVCEIENGGILKRIEEKPEYNFMVNTGMYILNKEVLKEIPDNQPYDMIDLIRKVKEVKGRVGVYPVNKNAWQDIGQWNEYKKVMEHIDKYGNVEF